MSKTINILGRAVPITILAISLMSVGGLAALVTYISNTVSASVTVESPLALSIAIDTAGVPGTFGTEPLSLGNIKGGESVTFWVKTKNLADASISGTVYNVINNPSGISCADFASLASTDTGINPAFAEIDTTGALACYQLDEFNVRLKTTPTEPWTWSAGHEDNGKFTVKFATNAVGTYTVTSYVQP